MAECNWQNDKKRNVFFYQRERRYYYDAFIHVSAAMYLKPLLVQIANAVIKSDKYPECRERYRRIKARRGHKKAIIAVCRMLLTAIWNVLSKLVPYSAEGYLSDKLTEHSVVISKAQGLELLRKRGYIFKDDLPADSA